MKLRLVGMTVSMVALAGCAHGTMRGSVAMKESVNEAHVCLGEGEVKVGDRVALYKNVCTGGGKSRGEGAGCTKKLLGNGIVEETLNNHYSVVKVDPGVQFEEGTLVEKL